VVEGADAVAAAWRQRHDHLRLNTHRMFSHQPGARIPRRCGPFPARDDYVAYLQDYAAPMRLRPGTRIGRADKVEGGWQLAAGDGHITAVHAVIATGPDAVPVMPTWPGLPTFGGTVIHAGQFRNVADMAGRDVLVVGPGNSGVDLLGHLARSDAGKLWLSARSGMNITPLRLGGVPLHPVSLAARHLPVRWQDTTARAIQRLAFGDLARLGYPRSRLGAFTRQASDGVTIAVDDGFAHALKTGRITMNPPSNGSTAPTPCSPTAPAAGPASSSALPATAPAWNPSPATWSPSTSTACPPTPARSPHPSSPACGSSAWTAASTATCTSTAARPAS
jgi:cation diffusion facilitator CzcD-associated flavoprotein CzcO